MAESSSVAATGVTFNVSAGSNRALIVGIGEESSTGKPTGVTYGGQAMSPGPRATAGSGFTVTTQLFVLNDAGIQAATDANIRVQGVTGHDGQFRLFAATYEKVGQTGIVDSDTSGNTAEVAPPVTISSTARSSALAMFGNSVNGVDVAWTTASEQIEEDASSSYFSIAEQFTDGSNVTFEPSADPINNNCLSAISLRGLPQTVAVGLASETGTAFGTSPQRGLNVGQAAEVDTAFGVTPETGENVAVGLASETDTAFGVTPVTPGKIAVGLASETDTAFGITPAVGISVGLASETDTAQSVTFRREVVLEQAVEINRALRVTSPSQVVQAALDARNTAGTTSAADLARATELEAKRLGMLRRQIEREEEELLAILPAVVRVLMNFTR